MVIGILYGEAGSGKSENALHFEEPIIVYDMEDRLKKKIDKHFPEKLIDRINLAYYKPDFTEDKVKSFDEFTNEVKKLLSTKEEDLPKTVIVDGIGDLRNYAEQKWLTYAKTKDGKPRKSAQNPGDYEEINTLVRNALFPMVNWVRYWDSREEEHRHEIHLIWTSQMRDNYQKIRKSNGEEDSVKAGRIPSHKDWCDFRVNFLVKLWQPKNKDGEIIPGQYMATCPKAEDEPGWEEDITGKNLYDVFVEKGMM